MPETVEVKDQFGKPLVVPTGVDGVNPVSPDNPNPKAIPAELREAAIAARAAAIEAEAEEEPETEEPETEEPDTEPETEDDADETESE